MLLLRVCSFSLLLASIPLIAASDVNVENVEATEIPTEEADSNERLTQKDSSEWTSKDIAFVASPLISLIGIGLIVYYTRKNAISEHWLKTNEREAEYLQNKLDKFYGPFILISEANHLMAQDLRSRQPKPEEYRLLDKLFDTDWLSSLSEGDRALVKEICNAGERLISAIKENAGLVDPNILPYISRAITHFRILHLAYEGKLGKDKTPFLRYIYPKMLDPVLRLELHRLQERLELLREEPTKLHGKLPALDLSKYPLPVWPDSARPDYVEAEDRLKPAQGPGDSLLSSERFT